MRKMKMSNPRKWRAKARTGAPNARQKRNGLYLDAHPFCHHCHWRLSKEAHHRLPKKHKLRYDWRYMEALCRRCHIVEHQQAKLTIVINR
ncbi:HNH endonuclease [Sphingomonas sp. Leaf17]|uniref:HNH endonuclease n=1 Tax=Sphingomonas sp. Leaf17 TaxID=1735683 RepID=UPI0012E242CA|nr:HNH endonuclease [Sphingomonas sp. Leaf17]